jgi:hypothetical protein
MGSSDLLCWYRKMCMTIGRQLLNIILNPLAVWYANFLKNLCTKLWSLELLHQCLNDFQKHLVSWSVLKILHWDCWFQIMLYVDMEVNGIPLKVCERNQDADPYHRMTLCLPHSVLSHCCLSLLSYQKKIHESFDLDIELSAQCTKKKKT